MREQRPAALETGNTAPAIAAIDKAIAALERRFGPGVVYRLSQAKPKLDTLALPTGSLGLDRAIGLGGVPRGRITELFGPPSCGKTTLAYHILTSAQSNNGLAAFVDAAQIMDGEAMLGSGVDLDQLLIAVPVDPPETFEIVEILARCRALDAIVLILPASALTNRMSEVIGKLNATLKTSPTAMVFVHEPTPGRGSLPFYASLRIALSPLRAIRASGGDLGSPAGDVAGLRVQATVVKNKLAPPGGTAEFIVRQSGGIYHEAELLDLALSHSLIEQLPVGLVYQEHLLGRSTARALAYLARNSALAAKLKADLQEKLWLTSPTS